MLIKLCNIYKSSSSQVLNVHIVVKGEFTLGNQTKLNQILNTIKVHSLIERQDLQKNFSEIFNQVPDQSLAYLHILKSLEKVQQRQIIAEITSEIILQQKYPFSEELFSREWDKIPINFLSEFFRIYAFDPERVYQTHMFVEQVINNLLQHKKITDAHKLITIFHKQLDISAYMNKFIQIDRIVEFAKVVEQIPDYVPIYIALLEKNHLNKVTLRLCTELIKKFQLDKNQFPQLLEQQQKNAVDTIYFPKINECHNRVEERLEGQPQMLKHVVDKLLQAGKAPEAYSIVKRNKQLQMQYQVPKQFQCIPNPFLEIDAFDITESVCLGQDRSQYILLDDFNITQENVHFVDSINSLKEAKHAIWQSEISGFDTEFCHHYNDFDNGGIALLQIATPVSIYIFDAVKLAKEPEFIEFVQDYFESGQTKIGHSVGNDMNEIRINVPIPQMVQINHLVDLAKFFNDVIGNQNGQAVSLANQAYQLFGKKLSKQECFSNWERRPLRQCQTYYAAMDAYICIKIYEMLQQYQDKAKKIELHQLEGKKGKMHDEKVGFQGMIVHTESLIYHKEYEPWLKRRQQKFLIDQMIKKLAGFLRNLGIDAAYVEKSDHQLSNKQAIDEERIIVTRDKSFFNKGLGAPCYFIKHELSTEEQYKDLLNFFQFKVKKGNLLSRCVKCNHDKIKLISWKEAAGFLDFKNQGYQDIKEYWQCEKCQQVYWEGNQFKNSLNRFSEFAK